MNNKLGIALLVVLSLAVVSLSIALGIVCNKGSTTPWTVNISSCLHETEPVLCGTGEKIIELSCPSGTCGQHARVSLPCNEVSGCQWKIAEEKKTNKQKS